jgi:ubiquinone/menaquinone biosynthesis C-methylase UbiE
MAIKMASQNLYHHSVGFYRLRTGSIDRTKRMFWRIIGRSKFINKCRDELNNEYYQALKVLCNGRSVLELGCGQGYTLALASEYGARSCCGIDLSDAMLGFAKKNYINISLVKGECIFLPFRDMCFDIVVCVNLLHHLTPTQRYQTLTEALRVAKRFIIFDNLNFESAIPNRLAQLFWKLTDDTTHNYSRSEWMKFFSSVKVEKIFIPKTKIVRQFFAIVSRRH